MLKHKDYRLYDGSELIGSFSTGDTLKVKLVDNLDLFNVPIDFHMGYIKGQREFEGKTVFNWVKDRVIPPGRQNIGDILDQVGIKEYDELAIFLYAKGKFTQDTFRIEEIT